MSEQKVPVLDGFGHSVEEQVLIGGSQRLLYGAPPSMGRPGRNPPPTPPAPKPTRYQLSVTGPSGTELAVSLDEEQWQAVRGKILEALK